jgi:PPOX class probable F420-dependent enzyme
VCYAFDGVRFYTPLDEKPKRVADGQLRRVRNIAARREVALLIDQYDDDWAQLGYVLIEGWADLLPVPSASAPATGAAHAQALALLRQRYAQYRTMALERRPVIAITPERVVSWGPALGQRAEHEPAEVAAPPWPEPTHR